MIYVNGIGVLVTDDGSEPELFGDDVEEAEGFCKAVSMARLLLFGDWKSILKFFIGT